MRTDNSIKNAKFAALMTVITVLFGFITQRVFISILGSEYLGINGLFSNILSILSVVELGFGNAIIFSMYRPIARNDKNKILSLLSFYRRAYRIIAAVVLTLGVCAIPFIGYFIGEISINDNIYVLYLLALLDTVCSYLLAYRRSVLIADQKTYIINIIHTLYVVSMNFIQIITLLVCRNFVIFLVIKILFRLMENLIISKISKKKYLYTKNINGAEKIDLQTKKIIKKQMNGLLYHKISSAIVLSTDNLIISRLFGVISVGIYANYYLIINAINELFNQIFSSITATIGNLITTEKTEKAYEVYKKMLFINSWMYTLAGSCILCVIQPFISVWLGESYLMPYHVIVVLVINFYVQGMRKTNARFKEAAGIYYEDRFMPIIESIVNLLSSIILGKIFGIAGVFIGTIVSSLVLYLYSYPVYMYKRLFKKKYSTFIILHIKHFTLSAIIMCITCIISLCLCECVDSYIIRIVIAGFVGLTMSITGLYLMYHKSSEYCFLCQTLKKMVGRKNEK